MDARQLQYVLSIAEHQSFTKAAKALFIAQPSLSSYIAKVEAELEVTLFDRSTTPLTLTYAGEKYVENARKILEITDNMKKEFRDLSQNIVGRIRVGIPRERAAYMMPLIIREYRKVYPGVEIQIYDENSSNIINSLKNGKIEIVIMPHTIVDENILTEDICSEELLLVSSGNYIDSSHLIDGIENSIDITKLEGIPFITLRKGHGIRNAVDELFAKHHIKPNIVMETSSNITAYRLASAGMGVTMVPRMTIDLIESVDKVQIYSITAVKHNWHIIAAYRKDFFMGMAEREFIATIRRLFN